MTNAIQNLSVEQLRKAIAIKAQIEKLQQQLASVTGAQSRPVAKAGHQKKRHRMSAAGRARIAAAAKARWAKFRGKSALEKPAKKKRFSTAAKAKLSAAVKARWKKAKAAGKTRL
jgi:hypothetical protein